jgi:nuclear cap-binding protein subunit 1
MVSITMFKVTNRVRQVVHERDNPALPFDSRKQIDEALPNERQAMRDLFSAIEDAVAGVASGAQDEMMEQYDGPSEERDLIMLWGARWARVWRRKAAVEEAVVGEAVVGALEEPAPVEPAGEAMDDFDQAR